MIAKSKIKELALFLNMPEPFIMTMDRAIQQLPGYAKWIQVAVADWDSHAIDQNKKQNIEWWFRTNDKYISELSDVHSRKTRKKISIQIIAHCKNYGVQTILDYGGGIGEESLYAARAGMDASMADLPSLTFEFAQWRAGYYHLPILFIPVLSETPLTKMYDAITCLEVLPHVFDPEFTAAQLLQHLNPNGILFVTTRFNNPTYSMALQKNSHFDEGMVRFFTAHELSLVNKIYQYGEGEKEKYLYVYQKK